MEHGTIEREIHIQASPATVFEVITSPEHLREWWPDEAVIEARPGATGHLVFGDPSGDDAHLPQITVLEVVPPERFTFRWTHPEGEEAREGNSLLVVFELAPDAGGTRLRMTESGFREMGWEVAVLEQMYAEHVDGWAYYLPKLVAYAPTVEVAA